MIIRQVVKMLAICIIGHICFVFWIFCSEIDFQILETIFEKNAEVSNQCEFFRFYIEKAF